MSSKPSKSESGAPFMRTYTVSVAGPVNIGGVLKRKGNPVVLSDAQAKIYEDWIKPAKSLKPTKGADQD